MTNVGNVTTLEELAQEFDGLFKRRVFRLEKLDYYDAENEREPYARFLAGKPVDPAWREPWKARVRGIRKSGRIMQRVHVVSEPATPYIQFSLLHGYPASVEAGEDVRVISRAELMTPTLRAASDYWLFDDNLAAVLVYDLRARVRRVRMADPYDQPHLLSFLRDARDEALRLAIPLDRYVAEHNITEKEYAA